MKNHFHPGHPGSRFCCCACDPSAGFGQNGPMN
jgi:hypothetical protein